MTCRPWPAPFQRQMFSSEPLRSLQHLIISRPLLLIRDYGACPNPINIPVTTDVSYTLALLSFSSAVLGLPCFSSSREGVEGRDMAQVGPILATTPSPFAPLHIPPLVCRLQLCWGLNFLSRLRGLHVFRCESWPPKANASQAASTMHMAAPIRPFDLSLGRNMPRKCKKPTDALIFIMLHILFELAGGYQCCCVLCVHVFVLEIRSLICLNRYSLVIGGVGVL